MRTRDGFIVCDYCQAWAAFKVQPSVSGGPYGRAWDPRYTCTAHLSRAIPPRKQYKARSLVERL